MSDHVSEVALSAHLDGALEDPEERQLARHLTTCLDCAHRLELLGATARAISGLPGEPLPAPLDLSFLAPRTARSDRVLGIPTRGRWRPPAWAAPMVAAAAVLLVAVTVGPGLLPRGSNSTATSSAGNSTGRYSLQGPGLASSSPQAGAGGGPASAPAGGTPAAPFATTEGRHASSTFPQSGGVVVELSGSDGILRAGQAVRLTLVVRAASTTVQTQSSNITILSGNASQPVAAAGSETIAPGQFRSLTMNWVAGKLGSAAESPGDYKVVGEVKLSDGSNPSVFFIIHVS